MNLNLHVCFLEFFSGSDKPMWIWFSNNPLQHVPLCAQKSITSEMRKGRPVALRVPCAFRRRFAVLRLMQDRAHKVRTTGG